MAVTSSEDPRCRVPQESFRVHRLRPREADRKYGTGAEFLSEEV